MCSMNKHLRTYLLHCGYIILPAYILTRHTFVGFLFPNFATTTTSILSALVLGGITCLASSIYGYITSSEKSNLQTAILRGAMLLFLFLEFISVNGSPIQINYWGPYRTLWTKAALADMHRTAPSHPLNRIEPKQIPPFMSFYIAGLFPDISPNDPNLPKNKAKAKATPVTVRSEKLEETSAVPTRTYTKLSGVSKVGALIDGNLLRWGRQADGSQLAPNADFTGIIIILKDGTRTTLVLQLPEE
jgi:hypothetical protein